MNIYTVRHAQSVGNVNPAVLHTKTNLGIGLTELGLIQAKETGVFLASKVAGLGKVVLWNSPYERTRQTANIIAQELKSKAVEFEQVESIYLSERQFGLVDDTPEYHLHYKNEARHYKLHVDDGKEFFVRPPLGESPMDLAIRMDNFIRTVLNQRSEEQHIIVSHGAALRAFGIMYLGQTYESYGRINPDNASVRLIGAGMDQGFIFTPKNKSA